MKTASNCSKVASAYSNRITVGRSSFHKIEIEIAGQEVIISNALE